MPKIAPQTQLLLPLSTVRLSRAACPCLACLALPCLTFPLSSPSYCLALLGLRCLALLCFDASDLHIKALPSHPYTGPATESSAKHPLFDERGSNHPSPMAMILLRLPPPKPTLILDSAPAPHHPSHAQGSPSWSPRSPICPSHQLHSSLRMKKNCSASRWFGALPALSGCPAVVWDWRRATATRARGAKLFSLNLSRASTCEAKQCPYLGPMH